MCVCVFEFECAWFECGCVCVRLLVCFRVCAFVWMCACMRLCLSVCVYLFVSVCAFVHGVFMGV